MANPLDFWGFRYLVGKIKFKLLFRGPLAEQGNVTNIFIRFFFSKNPGGGSKCWSLRRGCYGAGREPESVLATHWKRWGFCFLLVKKITQMVDFFGKRIWEVGQGFWENLDFGGGIRPWLVDSFIGWLGSLPRTSTRSWFSLWVFTNHWQIFHVLKTYPCETVGVVVGCRGMYFTQLYRDYPDIWGLFQ